MDDLNNGCSGEHFDSFIVPAKNLKVGKQSDRWTVTETRSELDEDNGEDKENNYNAIEEKEVEHESELELEVDGPPFRRTKQRQRIAESDSEEEIPPLQRSTRQRIAESELVEERPPFEGQQEKECRATDSQLCVCVF